MTKNAANACGDSWSKCNRCAAVAQATIVHQAHARKDETTALKGRRIAARNLRGHLATIAVTAPDLRGHLAATTAARNLRGHRAGTIAARNLLGRLATTNVVRNLRGRLAATALVARNLHGRDPRVVEALSRHGPATVPNAAVAIRRWTGVHLAASR